MYTILPTKVEITKSNKQYGEGSTGFICAAAPISPYNAVKHIIIFNKFGKNGKDRLFAANIYTPWLKIDDFITEQECEIYDRIKYTEQFEQRQKNAKKGIYALDTPPIPDPHEISFKPLNIPPDDLSLMDIWDFIAYITALSLCIRTAGHNRFGCKRPLSRNRNIGPGANDLQQYLNNPNFGPILGDHLLLEFHQAERNEEDHDGARFNNFMHLFSEIHNRRAILNMLHTKVTYLKPVIANYMDLLHNQQSKLVQTIRAVISIYKEKPHRLDDATIGYEADVYPMPLRRDTVVINPPRKAATIASNRAELIRGVRSTRRHNSDDHIEGVEVSLNTRSWTPPLNHERRTHSNDMRYGTEVGNRTARLSDENLDENIEVAPDGYAFRMTAEVDGAEVAPDGYAFRMTAEVDGAEVAPGGYEFRMTAEVDGADEPTIQCAPDDVDIRNCYDNNPENPVERRELIRDEIRESVIYNPKIRR